MYTTQTPNITVRTIAHGAPVTDYEQLLAAGRTHQARAVGEAFVGAIEKLRSGYRDLAVLVGVSRHA